MKYTGKKEDLNMAIKKSSHYKKIIAGLLIAGTIMGITTINKDTKGNELNYYHIFTTGDYVRYSIENQRLKITKCLSKKSENCKPLYEAISDDGKLLIISESLLVSYPKEIFEMEEKISLKAREILKFLNISNSDNPIMQLENAMKIHKYIVQNVTYKEEIIQEKNNTDPNYLYLNDLYNGLINKKGICTTDALIFKHLLSKIGMYGDVIILRHKNKNNKEPHAVILVKIGNEAYYFDTTLERTIFEKNSNNPNKFVFCCAGLGQKEFYKYYTPLGVLPENLDDDLMLLPQNISKESIPKTIIQDFGSEIEDLKFDETEPNVKDKKSSDISRKNPSIKRQDDDLER